MFILSTKKGDNINNNKNMFKNKAKTELERLGFSSNEALVYLSLLDNGPCGTGPLISETGFHRNVVYTALDHLISKKMIGESQVRGKKQFSVVSASYLVEDHREMAKLAEDLAQEIQMRLKLEVQEITTHTGNDEYLMLLSSIINSLPLKSVIYVLGTGGEDFMKYTMKPLWKKYHKLAREKQVKIKMIAYENQRPSLSNLGDESDMYEIKYLASSMENPVGVHVYPEAGVVLNIIYSEADKPVTAVKIKNKLLAEGYLNFFNNLWGMGSV